MASACPFTKARPCLLARASLRTALVQASSSSAISALIRKLASWSLASSNSFFSLSTSCFLSFLYSFCWAYIFCFLCSDRTLFFFGRDGRSTCSSGMSSTCSVSDIVVSVSWETVGLWLSQVGGLYTKRPGRFIIHRFSRLFAQHAISTGAQPLKHLPFCGSYPTSSTVEEVGTE